MLEFIRSVIIYYSFSMRCSYKLILIIDKLKEDSIRNLKIQ